MRSIEKQAGFSLIELLIYIAIFVTSSTFLVAILTSVTKIQVRQGSVNAVNRQIRFVSEFLERKVQESSAIDMEVGASAAEIVLRMPKASSDPTRIYLENGALLMREGAGSPTALTDENVVVDNFRVTKLENPGGRAVVEAILAMGYDTESTKARFSRVIELAMTRISAADFDSDLVPKNSNLNIGTEASKWQDGYFSGSLGIGGGLELTGAGNGILLRSPDGVCHRLSVANGGSIVIGACN